MILTQTFKAQQLTAAEGALLALVPLLCEQMRARGYAPASLRGAKRLAQDFATWLDQREICVRGVEAGLVDEYLEDRWLHRRRRRGDAFTLRDQHIVDAFFLERTQQQQQRQVVNAGRSSDFALTVARLAHRLPMSGAAFNAITRARPLSTWASASSCDLNRYTPCAMPVLEMRVSARPALWCSAARRSASACGRRVNSRSAPPMVRMRRL